MWVASGFDSVVEECGARLCGWMVPSDQGAGGIGAEKYRYQRG